MATITTLIERGSGPYGQPLRVKVLCRGYVIDYKGKDGSDRQSLTVAVCDGISCCRVVCYDQAKFMKLKPGNNVVLREVIVKTDDGPVYLVATRATKVFLGGSIEISEDQQNECERLINPPPAPTVSLTTALRSPVKQRNSIQGKITQEDQTKTVKVRGNDVSIKTITVEDASGKAKVTLWRQASEAEVHAGDYISITDVTVNMYKNDASLSTTGKSIVEKTEAPVSVEGPMAVVAVDVTDGQAELLLEDDTEVTVPAELLSQVIKDDESVEQLTSEGPVNLTITRRGSEIVSVTIV